MPGVDVRVAGAACLPGGEVGVGVRAAVPLELVDHRVHRRPDRLRQVEHDVGVELPPGQFPPVGRRARPNGAWPGRPAASAGGCSPTSGTATACWCRRGRGGSGRRRSRRPRRRGSRATAAAPRPRPGSGSVDRRRDRSAPARPGRAGDGPSTSAGSIQLTVGFFPSPAGLRQPWLVQPRKYGVKTEYRPPSGLRTRPGRHRIRRSGGDQLDVLAVQGIRHRSVALAAVRAVVRRTWTAAAPTAEASCGMTPLRSAVHDQQPPAHAVVQLRQAPGQERPARRT